MPRPCFFGRLPGGAVRLNDAERLSSRAALGAPPDLDDGGRVGRDLHPHRGAQPGGARLRPGGAARVTRTSPTCRSSSTTWGSPRGTRAARPHSGRAGVAGPAKDVQLEVDCDGPTHPISPLIYGIAYAARHGRARTSSSGRSAPPRAAGAATPPPATTGSWATPGTPASDWFFENVNYTGDPDATPTTDFLEANLVARAADGAHGAHHRLGREGHEVRRPSRCPTFGPQQAACDPDTARRGQRRRPERQAARSPGRRRAPACPRRPSSSAAG